MSLERKRVHFFLDPTEYSRDGNDSSEEDMRENIHSTSVINDQSSEANKMENIFSSYYTQNKVSQHLWIDQCVEIVRSLPYGINGIKVF